MARRSPSLPPSVLSVLEGDSNGGSYTPIRSAAVGEWELTMDSAVSGSRSAHDRRRSAGRRPLIPVCRSPFLLTAHSHVQTLRGRLVAAALGFLVFAGTRSSRRSVSRDRRGDLCGVTASTPTFWTVSTQADFLKGDVEDLSIDSDGRMFPGPSASLLAETAAPFLWTVVAGRRRHSLGRQRERRQGPEGRQGRQAVDVL